MNERRHRRIFWLAALIIVLAVLKFTGNLG